MSLIADALRKAESSGPAVSPTPPSPGSLWIYRAILLGSVAVVLAGLGAVAKGKSRPQAQQPATAVSAPVQTAQKPAGLQILRTAQGGLSLNGIVHGGSGKSLALINNEVVEEGGKIRGAKLVRIGDQAVELEEHGRSRTLKLEE